MRPEIITATYVIFISPSVVMWLWCNRTFEHSCVLKMLEGISLSPGTKIDSAPRETQILNIQIFCYYVILKNAFIERIIVRCLYFEERFGTIHKTSLPRTLHFPIALVTHLQDFTNFFLYANFRINLFLLISTDNTLPLSTVSI